MKKNNLLTFFASFLGAGLVLMLFLFFSQNKSDSEDVFLGVFKKNYRIFSPYIPSSVNFAGEPCPTDLVYIREKLDRELLINTYWHTSTLLNFKRAYRYFPEIEKILAENGIPDDFKYLALTESGLMNVVSPSGAAGFWQFMEKTAREYSLEVNTYVDERYHFEKSTNAACKYILDAYEEYGSWSLTAAAYNAGKGRISESLKNQSVGDYYDLYLNKETSRYIFRILAIKTIFQNPTQYGFYLKETDMYPPVTLQTIEIDSTILNLADFAKQQGTNYMLLKNYNPWLRSKKLPVGNDKKYFLDLPLKKDLFFNNLTKGYDDQTVLGDSITFERLY
ncbi:MAG: lytic transglycosylase domain-containing protein [Bacteroidales bacterium]|nr:lytic transglycosylase domain-containing protein [Bacteroidales bacterium]